MKSKDLFFIALVVGMIFQGTSVFFTFEGTYDAYVHMFFADHYAENWFSTWNEKWYTGFTITSYPPLVHQLIALFSFILGLKGGFLLWSFLVVALFIRGVYVFSLLWVNEKAAAIAALAAAFSTSFTEALQVFGQLPSITGISLLLNACPELYKWLRYNRNKNLILGLSLLAVTSTAHHVTTIFGLVFFIFPVLGLAVIDRSQSKKSVSGDIQIKDFIQETIAVLPRIMALCFLIVFITILVIFPYWYWSKSDPITQVPIPHGSRDSYIEVLSSGLVFFLIPWGMMLFFLPFLFSQLFRKRNIFLGLSVALLFILGTGGTTPIPRTILGSNAFDILTLDRFTFWATILSLPFWGMFLGELLDFKKDQFFKNRSLKKLRRPLVYLFLGCIILSNILIVNFRFFRKIQPDKIELKPMLNFLEVDKHEEWRFMTLGFGDQMAWLSANTNALSVDGNYHSVRRLPELTSRAVERLENAKYLGTQGIASLQQFLNVPEKYNLKYIFSNDKFYDPLLYYTGWTKVQRLDNDIIVWERQDVPSLPSVVPRKEIPRYQRFMWGTIPLTMLTICIILFSFLQRNKTFDNSLPGYHLDQKDNLGNNYWLAKIVFSWAIGLAIFIFCSLIYGSVVNNKRSSPEKLLQSYYKAIDFKKFKDAYALFDPDERPDPEQYMVQVSLESGILSSYAKLDSLSIQYYTAPQKNQIHASVKARWITALLDYETVHDYSLIKKGLLWYLMPLQIEPQIPPDQLIRLPEMNYYIQGRRKINENKLQKEDVLDRPEVIVQSAALVKKDHKYHIVGSLINVDDSPAFVRLVGVLYDDLDQEILRYNTTDIIVHNLLPGEKTPFRIDFSEAYHTYASTYVEVSNKEPVKFILYVQTMAIDNEFYRYTGIQNIEISTTNQVKATLKNYGHKEIIIPQIIFQIKNQNETVWWVDRIYMPYGIKQQRKKDFSFSLVAPETVELIYKGTSEQIVINGVSMSNSLYQHRVNETESGSINVMGNHRLLIKTNPFTESIYAD